MESMKRRLTETRKAPLSDVCMYGDETESKRRRGEVEVEQRREKREKELEIWSGVGMERPVLVECDVGLSLEEYRRNKRLRDDHRGNFAWNLMRASGDGASVLSCRF